MNVVTVRGGGGEEGDTWHGHQRDPEGAGVCRGGGGGG